VTEISCHEKAAAVFLLNDDLSEKTAAALMLVLHFRACVMAVLVTE